MRKASLWLCTVTLIIIGLLIYGDHNFTNFTNPSMIFTSVLICLTLLLAIIATFSEAFNNWIGPWWVIPDGILFGWASMLDYATTAQTFCFIVLFIICIYVEVRLFDDKKVL